MDADNNVPRGPEDLPLKGYVKEHHLVIILKDVKVVGVSARNESIIAILMRGDGWGRSHTMERLTDIP